jgi:hypothetical protein
MPFITIIIGAIIAIVAFRGTHGDLAAALEQDIPAYFKWAIAIAAILGLGFVPGLKIPSRYLIALVALVVILTNYRQLVSGFTQFASASPAPSATAAAEPTAPYVQSAGQTTTPPSSSQIAGTPDSGGTQTASSGSSGGGAAKFNPLNPNSYIGLAAGFGGLA